MLRRKERKLDVTRERRDPFYCKTRTTRNDNAGGDELIRGARTMGVASRMKNLWRTTGRTQSPFLSLPLSLEFPRAENSSSSNSRSGVSIDVPDSEGHF